MGKISNAMDKFQKEHLPPVGVKKEKPVRVKKEKPAVVKREAKAPVEETPAIQGTFLKKDQKLMSSNGLERNLITFLRPRTYEAEQFRMLKSHLLYPAEDSPPRSIMVTSAVPGEGKSFVASNLAITIAQNINEHVLLVDCDIRKPTIHKNFGFGELPGLSDYLSSDISLSSLLLKTDINKLTILPGGIPPENPTELLSSIKMTELLDELGSRYNDRYIIMDSPPPKLTSETNVLARRVDGIIIVIKYRSTKRKMVSDIVDVFGKDKILGIVLNRYDIKSYSYGYHGYGKLNRYYESYQR